MCNYLLITNNPYGCNLVKFVLVFKKKFCNTPEIPAHFWENFESQVDSRLEFESRERVSKFSRVTKSGKIWGGYVLDLRLKEFKTDEYQLKVIKVPDLSS